MRRLYMSATNCSGIEAINVIESHDLASAQANITCKTHSLTIGDSVTINIGYSDSHENVFTGYVKQIDRKMPDSLWEISCQDKMVQALDYFIASEDPDSPLKYQNIAAETLVGNLMTLAGLTSYTYDATFFTFGVQAEFEINLVSVHDYCRMIGDLLTWSLWCDSTGTVHFENRKPYVMTSLPEPGHDADPASTVTLSEYLTLNHMKDIQNLRNRIVVYGNSGIHAEASASSPYLPGGFYKTSVLSAPGLIDDQGMAQDTADYNLTKFNRLTETVTMEIVGNETLRARQILGLNIPAFSLSGDWYCLSCNHKIGRSGYTTDLVLRK